MLDFNKIRNFGIIAHIDAGKTTTTERILYLTGTIHKIGEVDDGTTITDYLQEERERGITIIAAAVSCNWKDCTYHIIDTPGHVDFTAEVQRSLRVLDGAIVVFCGVSGVQTQSETVWKQADAFNVPRIVFINKLDRIGANFEFVLEDIRKKLKVTPVPITIPYYVNDSLKGIINIIKMKLELYDSDGKTESVSEIPEAGKALADKYREKLINVLTSYDDRLLELALNDKITEEIIISSLRTGTIKRNFVPVLSGTSFKNIGTPPLLDAINDLLPSPVDIGSIDGYYIKKDKWEKILFDASQNPVAYVFKVQYHREKGIIAFIRIYSGKIKNGDILFNPRTKKRERIQDLLKVYADKYERLTESVAGDIVAVSGIKDIFTGDTLCSEGHQVMLERLKFPEPVIHVSIEPKNTMEKEKLVTLIEHQLLEDPTVTCKEDEQTGQTLIAGMGELHIQVFLDRIKHTSGIEVKSGAPQVSYRETPKKKGSFNYHFDKKIEGNVQHVDLTISITPNERTKGNQVKFNIKSRDKAVLANLEKGITSALKSGPEGAYPVIDSIVTVESVSYDDNKTSLIAFEASANLALSFLLREVGTILLEPIMKLEIDVPTEYTGSVIGDLQSKNGFILDIHKSADQDIIFAKAPLKVMFGYTTTLRSLTQGKGKFTMEFLNYDAP